MRYLGSEKIQCCKCKAILDVPLYINGDEQKYGFKFCHQCGESLFVDITNFDFMSKDFLYWLTNDYYRLFCDRTECSSCPFSINNNGFELECTELSNNQVLQIIKQMYDKNKDTSFLRG